MAIGMHETPPPCMCGEVDAARSEVSADNPNPQCHICRKIATEQPGLTTEEVAKAGKKRWRELTKGRR